MYKNTNQCTEHTHADFLNEPQLQLFFKDAKHVEGKDIRVLSLFSGCGGMDLGFEGNFIAHKKSVKSEYVHNEVNKNWVMVNGTRFQTVFANDILKEAQLAWNQYMSRFGYDSSIYHHGSVVDLVKQSQSGAEVFPTDIDVVTGGFPCQDFSVAGKRRGFQSKKDHLGHVITEDNVASEETRGKLYYWMREVVNITKPKIFIAENVKGLVNLGDVKRIIQQDFSQADGNGYIVLDPQVLHAGNYGVPESRERVIFIGIRKDALRPEALKALTSEKIPEEYYPYPVPTHACTPSSVGKLPQVTVGDVFHDLKEPAESNDLSQIFYSQAKFMGTHCQGQKEVALDKIGPTIRSEHHGNIEYRRLSKEHGGEHKDELKAGMQERRLTPRECALIQTFPPDYPFVTRDGYSRTRFKVSSSAAYKIIGNAVPPLLAYNIAIRLEELWPKYFK
jgi:DNA (cytosine-5)-methyltransferase 1